MPIHPVNTWSIATKLLKITVTAQVFRLKTEGWSIFQPERNRNRCPAHLRRQTAQLFSRKHNHPINSYCNFVSQLKCMKFCVIPHYLDLLAFYLQSIHLSSYYILIIKDLRWNYHEISRTHHHEVLSRDNIHDNLLKFIVRLII